MANWAGCAVHREASVDSTNRAARRWAAQGAPHGAAVVALAQTAGRGRLGRHWESPAGAGLYLSLVLRPGPQSPVWPSLTFRAALAAADACQAACGLRPAIKWPNDLVLSGRKISGILLEREGDAAVCGIGINVRQRAGDFPPELRGRAGSLEALSGRSVSLDALERALLASLEARMDAPGWKADYTAQCVTLGRTVRVLAPDGAFDGFAEGLDDVGALLVRDEAGQVRRVLAGDVSVRSPEGYV